jgi:uncharacterized protein (DUF1778 family)
MIKKEAKKLLNIRLTEAERKKIKELAKHKRQSVTAYILSKALPD